MSVFTGHVKDKLATFQALFAEMGDPEQADANDLAAVNRSLDDLNTELDVRIDELDDEIAGDVGLSAFGLPAGAWAPDAAAQLVTEAANVDQMTRLLDTKAYASRLHHLFAQVG